MLVSMNCPQQPHTAIRACKAVRLCREPECRDRELAHPEYIDLLNAIEGTPMAAAGYLCSSAYVECRARPRTKCDSRRKTLHSTPTRGKEAILMQRINC